MKRIGIVASRIAKDDLVSYNLFVLLLSFLLSFLIFLVSAFAVLAGMALTSYVTRGFLAIDAGSGLFRVALIALTLMVGVINLMAVLGNIKLKR
jgi:hypothetical protein